MKDQKLTFSRILPIVIIVVMILSVFSLQQNMGSIKCLKVYDKDFCNTLDRVFSEEGRREHIDTIYGQIDQYPNIESQTSQYCYYFTQKGDSQNFDLALYSCFHASEEFPSDNELKTKLANLLH